MSCELQAYEGAAASAPGGEPPKKPGNEKKNPPGVKVDNKITKSEKKKRGRKRPKTNNRTCWVCGQRGHIAVSCPRLHAARLEAARLVLRMSTEELEAAVRAVRAMGVAQTNMAQARRPTAPMARRQQVESSKEEEEKGKKPGK